MKRIVKSAVQRACPDAWLRYRAFDALVRDESSHLHRIGWVRSLAEGRPVDADGRQVPWMNYPVVAFLRERLATDHDLFEFGSGASTAFFAARVRTVRSVEYDAEWHRRVAAAAPSNVELVFRAADIDGSYCRTVLEDRRAYDVVVVDGRDRVNCVRQALTALTPRGVILLDDSDRPEYRPAFDVLRDHRFRTLTFEGLKPCETGIDSATLFYRDGNSFGL